MPGESGELSKSALDPFGITATPEEIHRDLEHALDKHAEWLQRWHRSVLCREEPSQDVISENAHYLCQFGAWFEVQKEGRLVDQPAFHALSLIHGEMHELARVLARKANKGGRINVVEHDLMTELVNEFNSQGRVLAKAFRKVLSDMDPLTGVHNRQQVLKELSVERERVLSSGKPCCIAIVDLDHFKNINDQHGHQVGDEVLRASVNRLMSEVRPYDTIFRYGGEEFLVCLPNSDTATALHVLERLRGRLSRHPIDVGDGDMLPVTASFGLVEMSKDASIKDYVDNADKALYQAKENGRDQVCYWDWQAGAVKSVKLNED